MNRPENPDFSSEKPKKNTPEEKVTTTRRNMLRGLAAVFVAGSVPSVRRLLGDPNKTKTDATKAKEEAICNLQKQVTLAEENCRSLVEALNNTKTTKDIQTQIRAVTALREDFSKMFPKGRTTIPSELKALENRLTLVWEKLHMHARENGDTEAVKLSMQWNRQSGPVQ